MTSLPFTAEPQPLAGTTAWPQSNAVGVGALLILVAAALATWASFHQFGGYDLSPLIDLFWRLRQGQVPGTDFINTWPPIVLMIGRMLAYAPADIGWYQFTFANIVGTLLAYAALVLLTPRHGRTMARCAAIAAMLSLPLLFTNHIWHSNVSQLCAAVFVMAFCREMELGRSHWALGIAAALLALAKQNVALPLLLGAMFLATVFGGERRWRVMLAIGGGAAAGVAIACLLVPMSLAGFVETYTSVLGRGRPSDEMITAVFSLPSNRLMLLLIGIAALLTTWAFFGVLELAWPTRLCLVGFFAIALLPIATDWDTKANNAPLPLVICSMAVFQPFRTQLHSVADLTRQKLMALVLVLALMVATYGAISRERMAQVGDFFEPYPSHRVEAGYFRGLQTGNEMAGVLADMERVKWAYPSHRLFFGPRIEFGYAVTALESPHGLPLWWHPGTSYALTSEQRVIAAFASNDFDVVIFRRGDRTRLPQALLDVVRSDYRPAAFHSETLEVFSRAR